jgi:hypothetical protein
VKAAAPPVTEMRRPVARRRMRDLARDFMERLLRGGCRREGSGQRDRRLNRRPEPR